MSTVADRIRTLMRAAELNQTELAHRIGLDPTKLSKSLNGTRQFSLADTAALAEEFGVTLDFLSTGEEPRLETAARNFGEHETGEAVAIAHDLTQRRNNLVWHGLPSRWAPLDLSGFESGTAISQGHRLAATALDRCTERGLDPSSADLADVVEQAFGADVAVRMIDAELDGLAASVDDAHLVLVNTTSNAPRQRFTLAHELGHLLFGDDQGFHLDHDVKATGANPNDLTELRANAFAAAFLMSEETLRERASGLDDDAFCRLAVDLLVSPSSLAFRLGKLALADNAQMQRWSTIRDAEAWERAGRRAQLARLGQTSSTERLPALLVEDTWSAYAAGETTLRPYATLTGRDVDELRDELEIQTAAS